MVTEYECLLLNMGWAVEDIVAHYEDNGYRVWEFLPVDGRIWLQKERGAVCGPTYRVNGVYG
jgi:hypothetical protein